MQNSVKILSQAMNDRFPAQGTNRKNEPASGKLREWKWQVNRSKDAGLSWGLHRLPFKAEEQLQRDIDYPGYEKHIAQHEIFKNTIKDLEEMLQEEEGPSNAFVEKVEENIVKWFYTHIEGFDRSVAEYKFMRENNERL